jgi:hypothetical protein
VPKPWTFATKPKKAKPVPTAVRHDKMCRDCAAAFKKGRAWSRMRIHDLFTVGGRTHAVRFTGERKADTWKRTATWTYDAACGIEFTRFVDSSD